MRLAHLARRKINMRISIVALSLAALFITPPHAQRENQEKEKTMSVKKATAVLFVQDVEPCMKFWVDRLGFEKTVEVPDGNKLAFVILKKGDVELMYQSYASVEKDVPAHAQLARKGPTFLYVEVDNLDEVIAAMKGVDVSMPVRTTFYGTKEIGYKDPGGHMITFAQLGVVPHQ
jgi:uncharacterized glyoxalase superfamily protein PhnB